MPLETLFSHVHNLPNIPKVVQELISNFNNPETDANDISNKIQMDQVISAKVMRLANSARYGAGRSIKSIDSAVVMLGFDTLKTLVMASGITGSFKDIPHFDKREFWRNSFMVANISKLIAKHTQEDPETAFTCGMMHNIGELLIHLNEPEKSTKIDSLVAEGAIRSQLQQNQFGYDFTEVGAELARRWNFPDIIQSAIHQHADPLSYETQNPLAAIVNLATYLNSGFSQELPKEDILGSFPADIAEGLNIDLLSLFEEIVELLNSEDDIDELLN